jgi:hypothetical protein
MGKLTEFTAMQRIANCLKDLSQEKKERVIAWAITFLEVERENMELEWKKKIGVKCEAERDKCFQAGRELRFDSADIGDPMSSNYQEIDGKF